MGIQFGPAQAKETSSLMMNSLHKLRREVCKIAVIVPFEGKLDACYAGDFIDIFKNKDYFAQNCVHSRGNFPETDDICPNFCWVEVLGGLWSSSQIFFLEFQHLPRLEDALLDDKLSRIDQGVWT